MNINFTNLPSASELIVTMDKHPVGSVLFIITLLILLGGLVACGWFYVNRNG